jgi:hypothetical protein
MNPPPPKSTAAGDWCRRSMIHLSLSEVVATCDGTAQGRVGVVSLTVMVHSQQSPSPILSFTR